MAGRLMVTCAGAYLAMSLCGCLFYDSRWGEASRSQHRLAKHDRGQAIERSAARERHEPSKPVKTFSIRALASREHRAQVRNWEEQFRTSVERANEALPNSNVRLELVSTGNWQPKTEDSGLEALISDLQQTDSGDDVDCVVGLVGAVAKVEMSFHQLGMANLLGKHMVLRAPNDGLEYRWIEENYTELSEPERASLWRSRQMHKRTAVFLHELGHSLGAVHVRDRSSIMHPLYNAQVTRFGASAEHLVDTALDGRTSAAGGERRAMARLVLSELERGPGDWLASEREQSIQWLSKYVGDDKLRNQLPTQEPADPEKTATDAVPAEADAALSGPDAALYRNALGEHRAGREQEAWQIAQPLFERYPADYAVQDLRCQIAMKRDADWDHARAECEGLMKLSPGFR